ncbi:MAG: thiamine phosphate synthase [Terracidiphilus sp.]
MRFNFPPVYPILDSSMVTEVGRTAFLQRIGEALTEAGVTLLEYRNKMGSEEDLKSDARILRNAMPPEKVKLILDDRVDLIGALRFDGVHVDAGDASPAEARNVVGPSRIVGTFGGSNHLLPSVFTQPADYFSIGPVFPTTTKETSKRPIGVEGVHNLRRQAGAKVVLVAVGGITLETARAVLDAGANTVAVAAAIFRAPDPAEEFRRWMKALD